MAGFFWSRLTAALAICSIASTLHSSYANPLSAGKNSTSKVNQSKSDCLFNQYYDIINEVCEDCTVCLPGTQHSSQEICGYGEGVNTTCEKCKEPEKKYQPHRGYSHLKCRSCVTCDPNADILQICNATHNAVCGRCHAGYYEFSPNLCLDCINNPSHEDCKRTTIPTMTPANLPSSSTNNLPSPTTNTLHPSLKTADPPSSSLPSGFTEGPSTVTELIVTGSKTTKGGALSFGLGIGAVIIVILICVALYWFIQWRKRLGSSSTSKPAVGNATYNAVPTINLDQPSTSSAVEAGIVCEPTRGISRQSSRESDREQLLGAGITETRPSFSPSQVTNDCPSMPQTLSISGGEIRYGLGIMYPHLHVDQGQFGYGAQMSTEGESGSPGSPDSAKVNFSFQGEDDQTESTGEPMGLRS